MNRLALDWEAAVGLWKMVSRDRVQLVAHAESEAGIRLRLADAQHQPLGGGAVGRAFAAAEGVDDSELAQRYAPVRWQRALSMDEYIRQIAASRSTGFAIDEELTRRGVLTVAVAMTDIASGLCYSASILSGSHAKAEVETLGAELINLRDAVAAEH